ncbi:unnamed protein product [Moneuplotes crassus]|uniref:Uncharacterized protein n=1 Tax=Euplotes crassus TaxID=5936 RepID=A0AAD1Y6I0_EUPCR|nr:unnamed protein product [Moneuplotes crassus]
MSLKRQKFMGFGSSKISKQMVKNFPEGFFGGKRKGDSRNFGLVEGQKNPRSCIDTGKANIKRHCIRFSDPTKRRQKIPVIENKFASVVKPEEMNNQLVSPSESDSSLRNFIDKKKKNMAYPQDKIPYFPEDADKIDKYNSQINNNDERCGQNQFLYLNYPQNRVNNLDYKENLAEGPFQSAKNTRVNRKVGLNTPGVNKVQPHVSYLSVSNLKRNPSINNVITKNSSAIKKSSSNPRDSRGSYIKQNAKLLLALKAETPSLTFGRSRRHASNYISNHANFTSEKDKGYILPVLQKRSRSDTKRAHSESPSRNANANSVVNNKDDILNSMKYNFVGNQGAPQNVKVEKPLFLKGYTKSLQRSNSENRMRNIYKNSIIHKKSLNDDPDVFKQIDFDKLNSEKKPKSGLQGIRRDTLGTKTLCHNIFGITNNGSANLITQENDVGGMDESPNPIPFNIAKLSNPSQECSEYSDDVVSKYNCTFFPKDIENDSQGNLMTRVGKDIQAKQPWEEEIKKQNDKTSGLEQDCGFLEGADERKDAKEVVEDEKNKSLFNPFEVAKNPKNRNKQLEFVIGKSKSDLGMADGFLSKVQNSVNSPPNRHSEVQRYNHNYTRMNYKSDPNSFKSDEVATSKCSVSSKTNKEASTYILENSSMSQTPSQRQKFSALKDSPATTKDPNNPFSPFNNHH